MVGAQIAPASARRGRLPRRPPHILANSYIKAFTPGTDLDHDQVADGHGSAAMTATIAADRIDPSKLSPDMN
jgi:hypothetical protein